MAERERENENKEMNESCFHENRQTDRNSSSNKSAGLHHHMKDLVSGKLRLVEYWVIRLHQR